MDAVVSSFQKMMLSPSPSPIAESIADEISIMMFGRSFSSHSDTRSLSRDRVAPAFEKRLSFERSNSKKLNRDQSAVRGDDSHFGSKSRERQESLSGLPDNTECTVASKKLDVPTTPTAECQSKENCSPDKASSSSEFAGAPSSEQALAHSHKRKSKSRRSKGERSRKVAEKGDEVPAQAESSASTAHLPDHILIPTFNRVMAQGLQLTLIADDKRFEMTFWIDADVLRWGKKRANGKERGSLILSELCEVEDTGPVELKLGASIGNSSIEFAASSLVEKALLFRSFILVLEKSRSLR